MSSKPYKIQNVYYLPSWPFPTNLIPASCFTFGYHQLTAFQFGGRGIEQRENSLKVESGKVIQANLSCLLDQPFPRGADLCPLTMFCTASRYLQTPSHHFMQYLLMCSVLCLDAPRPGQLPPLLKV